MDDKVPPYTKFVFGIFKIIDAPVTLFKEKFVDPLQSRNPHYYYHRRFRRVPTIDECETNDLLCRFEADEQFKRDKMVDNNILKILRQRRLECMIHEGADTQRKCKKIIDDYETSATNWFIKYGDLGAVGLSLDAYMKQKHRLIWERRQKEHNTGKWLR